VALQRGPIVYCAEWADNAGRTSNFIVPVQAVFSTKYEPELLHGIVTLQGEGARVVVGGDGLDVSTQKAPIVAIPYYAWANRGKGEMNIWFPAKVTDVELLTK